MYSYSEKLLFSILKQLNADTDHISPSTLMELLNISSELATKEDILEYIKKVAVYIDHTTTVKELLEQIEEETDIIVHKLKFINSSDRPHVALIDSTASITTKSKVYLRELVQTAGGIPVENVQQADKIIILSKDEQSVANVPTLLADPTVDQSNAVKSDQIFVITQNEFADVPGSDYLTELEILTEIIQPKYFVYGHEGKEWLQFQLQ